MVQEIFDMRHRIMFIMNVDWNWAKQRPHFIAQHLSLSQEVIVLYPFAWRRAHLVKNKCDGVKPFPFFRIPLGGRFSFVRKLNVFLLRIVAKVFLTWLRPDIVWVSSPELFEYLPRHLPAKVIYDCMDDVLAFPSNAPRKGLLAASERDLINASSHVFCSSANLRNKLIERAGCSEKYTVVHNAFEPSSFAELADDYKPDKVAGRYVLGYIGTISSWMDFEALFIILDEFPSVEIHLMGPIENLGIGLPKHDRIKYLGTVPHADIKSRVTEFDALIMPFKVTDLIQSVDPVKLYEYVFFNKPIVSVRYPEIERFSDFVDFYTDYQELVMTLNRYLSDQFQNKYLDTKRVEFISSNTWSDRVKQIKEVLGRF